MEGLFTHELTDKEYGKIVDYCCEQLKRLGYHIESPWGADEQEYYAEWSDTNRIMAEDYD